MEVDFAADFARRAMNLGTLHAVTSSLLMRHTKIEIKNDFFR